MHANIRNNEIIDFNSKYLDEDIIKVETTQAMYDLYQEDNRAVIYQNSEIVVNPEYAEIKLNSKKLEKIEENDRLRDEKLNSGVVYKDVLFDSDTDQKINLLATYNVLPENQKMLWFGKDNESLECTKDDLVAIGNLITELHIRCWTLNAFYKDEINKATNLEELNHIEIDYNKEEE